MNTYLILLLYTVFGSYFLIGLVIISLIIFAIIAYHWNKAAKANIEAWHKINKDNSLEPFYM